MRILFWILFALASQYYFRSMFLLDFELFPFDISDSYFLLQFMLYIFYLGIIYSTWTTLSVFDYFTLLAYSEASLFKFTNELFEDFSIFFDWNDPPKGEDVALSGIRLIDDIEEGILGMAGFFWGSTKESEIKDAIFYSLTLNFYGSLFFISKTMASALFLTSLAQEESYNFVIRNTRRIRSSLYVRSTNELVSF